MYMFSQFIILDLNTSQSIVTCPGNGFKSLLKKRIAFPVKLIFYKWNNLEEIWYGVCISDGKNYSPFLFIKAYFHLITAKKAEASYDNGRRRSGSIIVTN